MSDDRRDFRCFGCDRLLARYEPDAVRPGRVVEIKCRYCNTLNALRGVAVRGELRAHVAHAARP